MHTITEWIYVPVEFSRSAVPEYSLKIAHFRHHEANKMNLTFSGWTFCSRSQDVLCGKQGNIMPLAVELVVKMHGNA